MPIYETLTILHPDLAEARVKEVLTWMQQLVENGQGKVLQVEEWGMRDLAYRIQKQRRGYYVRLEYEATPAALQELERNFRLSEDVLRFLSIVRKAPSEKRPSVQPRSEAADREPMLRRRPKLRPSLLPSRIRPPHNRCPNRKLRLRRPILSLTSHPRLPHTDKRRTAHGTITSKRRRREISTRPAWGR